jgi:ATP-dependent helicase/nuclease subunit B
VAEAARPSVFTIPVHRPFADALATGLIAQAGSDRLVLARGLVLVPNNRAARAITDAFVRRAEGGLLLPRLVSIGDPELDDRIGPLFDPAGDERVPPAIDPLARQLILARLIGEARRADPIEPVEAIRLAADLARTLDQMILEEVAPARLADVVPPELSQHWQSSLDLLQIVLQRWPEELRRRGRIDLSERRNLLLDAAEHRWRETPPEGLIVAAGISTAAPAICRLLRRISRLPQGMVVFAGLDTLMPDAEWDALGGSEDGRKAIETHPQFVLREMLDRIGVGRSEVEEWPSDEPESSDRARLISDAMKPAAFTDSWQALAARPPEGLQAIELANPAAEAQAIAIALRESVETPGRTAALVTPDRMLATRVAAHLKRWGIEADDSAGQPLSRTPPGTLLGAIGDAAAENFAPVALLALLKHPLVRAGEARLGWLDEVRKLDRALRGPRPGPGLAEITRFLRDGDDRTRGVRVAALEWWRALLPILDPLAAAFCAPEPRLADLLTSLSDAATALAGAEAWSRPAGRAAAELIAGLQASAEEGPRIVGSRAFPAFLRTMADAVAVRPPQGGHPRIFIWGLIEARLQQTDFVILGGLNEGVWPSLPAPDPWLAPAIRAKLGLPGLERRIGVEAQQFAAGLGNARVLLTRARRDARAPAVASRFWLRLVAMSGGLAGDPRLRHLGENIDRPPDFKPAEQPRPRPPVADRPKRLAVTKLDRLKADPFAFYADAMLRLRAWDAVDADPSAAWRGSAVHKIFEDWIAMDDCDPSKLRPRAQKLLDESAAHPVLRTLWAPRLLEAIEWAADEVTKGVAEGRRPIAAERKGTIQVAGIELEGTVDRIDRLAGGGIAIVDWKTGQPPSKRAVAEGYSMQLGLLGLIAEKGGFEGISGKPEAFEYWSLASKDGRLGYATSPVGLNKQGQGIAADDFTTLAARVLTAAVEDYLKGDAPFVAKLHPEYAPYGDYDQLMRLDEWYGRGAGEAGE